MNNYRSRIYEKYVSKFKDGSTIFNEKDSLLWRKAYKWWFRHWQPTNKDAKILDVACGGGMLLHYFKDLGYTNICGVDISPEQVVLAKQVIENVTIGNALDYLEAHQSEYDLIVGLDIIEHFYKDEVMEFLDNCYSALKKGGRLILQAPNSESPWGLSIRYGDFTHEVGFTHNCLWKLLMLAGFEDIQGSECGPVPIGVSGIVRLFLWKILRLGLTGYNYIEAGNKGSGIYTRVFLITGIRD